jgi:hypothetical protein
MLYGEVKTDYNVQHKAAATVTIDAVPSYQLPLTVSKYYTTNVGSIRNYII